MKRPILLLLLILIAAAAVWFYLAGKTPRPVAGSVPDLKTPAVPSTPRPEAPAQASQQQALPRIAPPFQALNGARRDPVLKVGKFFRDEKPYDQPGFWIGNKRIGLRENTAGPVADFDQVVNVVVDDRVVLNLSFWGDHPASGAGYPFALPEGMHTGLAADAEKKTITFTKPYKLPDGGTAQFTSTLRALGDSQVELTWDLGVSSDEKASLSPGFGVQFWMYLPENEGTGPFRLSGKNLPLDAGRPENLQGTFQEMIYSPDQPLQRFSVRLDGGWHFSSSVTPPKNGKKQAGFLIRVGADTPGTTGRAVFDFGEVAAQDVSAPAPVAGIDFWGRDRMVVPAPTTRNIMPNPGFDQGLRYWAWWYGGGEYVPSDVPAYSTVAGGISGGSCLQITPSQGGQPMQSFTIPVEAGKTYTLSFFARSETPGSEMIGGVLCPLKPSQLTWQKALATKFPLSTDWQRKSVTFTADRNAVAVVFGSKAQVWVDNVQLEEGSVATDYVALAVQGLLKTSDPDNALALGAPLEASFEIFGAPGASGEVDLTLRDYYRDVIYRTREAFRLDEKGSARISLPWEAETLGTGIFVVQADLQPKGGPMVRDFYRFSIMEFLENRHATKDLFGNLCAAPRITRGDDLAKRYMQWGFGSTNYGFHKESEYLLLSKYRITNMMMAVSEVADPADRAFITDVQTKWMDVTPEGEKKVEEVARRVVADHPWGHAWAFTTETECRSPMIQKGKFSEWAKVQQAFFRGIKAANPQAIVFPDGGTSGFNLLRGFRETEGYLAATAGKVKWDAIATHPYGNLDGIKGRNDLDTETQRMLDLMAKYGFGDIPLDYTEGFNLNDLLLPEWGISQNADHYDTYLSGRPTYDSGWREFLQTAWAARIYLVCLKYWPQVRSFNIWVWRPYLDQYLAPLFLCKVPNTLGHLFANPRYVSTIQQVAGVRGYVYEDGEGLGIAAIWCNLDKVEQGMAPGPVLRANFGEAIPEFVDLMGNRRKVSAENGGVSIPLTPAPLFLVGAKGSAGKLAEALNQADVQGAGLPLALNVLPTLEGGLEVTLSNQTNRHLTGEISGDAQKTQFDLDPRGEQLCSLGSGKGNQPGVLYTWDESMGIRFQKGDEASVPWNMAYFYVPRTARPMPEDPLDPAWDAVPSLAIDNWHVKESKTGPVAAKYPGDLEARFQITWDESNLYVRISAKDDAFLRTEASKWRERVLYMHDGCAEVYFDAGANGRSNAVRGFDSDDYRYDFAPGSAQLEKGEIFRFAEPFHQLAGGIDMPTKDDAAKGITCRFAQTSDGYAYAMIFPQRYIEPLRLEKGTRAGFSLFLHDRDNPADDFPPKGVGLTTASGEVPDRRPDLWPIMVLSDE